MKKYLIIGTISFVVVLGLILGVLSFDKTKDATSTNAETNASDIDGLFRDMGFLQPIRITPPVEITLMDLNGKIVSVSDFRGKIVFINFWTTWCPSCRVEMPSMEKLHNKFKEKDFVMVAIDLQENAKVVKKFFEKYKLTFTSLLDSKGEVGARFGVQAIPITFILDKTGRIMGKVVGAREWDSKEALALFEYLIEQN